MTRRFFLAVAACLPLPFRGTQGAQEVPLPPWRPRGPVWPPFGPVWTCQRCGASAQESDWGDHRRSPRARLRFTVRAIPWPHARPWLAPYGFFHSPPCGGRLMPDTPTPPQQEWPGDPLFPDILVLRLPHHAGSRFLHFEDPAQVRAAEIVPGDVLVPLVPRSVRLVALRTFPSNAAAAVRALGPNEPDLPAGTRVVIGPNVRLLGPKQ